MKSVLRTVIDGPLTYQALMFVCPGCALGDGTGLHMLPVNNTDVEMKKPNWGWNGDLDKPTLTPSILSQGRIRCHSYLTEGVFNFLTDSEHALSGKQAEIPDLPDWVVAESADDSGDKPSEESP